MNKLYEVFNYVYVMRDVDRVVVSSEDSRTKRYGENSHEGVLSLLDERFDNPAVSNDVTALACDVGVKFNSECKWRKGPNKEIRKTLVVFPREVVTHDIAETTGDEDVIASGCDLLEAAVGEWQENRGYGGYWADQRNAILDEYFAGMIEFMREMDKRGHGTVWHFDFEGPAVSFDEPTEVLIEFIDEAFAIVQNLIKALKAHERSPN